MSAKVWSFVVLCSMVVVPLRAMVTTADSLFDIALSAYERGGYSAAGALYDSLLLHYPDRESVELRFNQALAYAKVDSLGLAYLAVLRAERLGGGNAEVAELRAHLEARMMSTVTFAEGSMVEGVPLWIWLFTGLAVFSWLLYWLTPSPRLGKWRFYVLGLSVASWLVVLAHFGWRYYQNMDRGLVLYSGQQLLETPEGVNGVPVSAGQPIRVVSEEGEWWQVILPDGVGGWLPKEQVGLLEPR